MVVFFSFQLWHRSSYTAPWWSPPPQIYFVFIFGDPPNSKVSLFPFSLHSPAFSSRGWLRIMPDTFSSPSCEHWKDCLDSLMKMIGESILCCTRGHLFCLPFSWIWKRHIWGWYLFLLFCLEDQVERLLKKAKKAQRRQNSNSTKCQTLIKSRISCSTCATVGQRAFYPVPIQSCFLVCFCLLPKHIGNG